MLAIGVFFIAGISSCDDAPAKRPAWPTPGPTPPQPAPQTSQLVFSTYLGGSVPCAPGVSPNTFAQNSACDALGNIYVTGATQVSDLPVLNAFQPSPAPLSIMSAFVAKYDPVGDMLWCTYLGGNHQSMGTGVAAMPDGGVVVVGVTTSDALGPIPVMYGFQEQNHGQSDYFVAVFEANGNLRYSTYLGGSGVEGTPGAVFTDDNSNGNNVAADAQGLVYVTGTTNSGGGGGSIKFPVTPNALQSDLAGSTNAFLCIINPAMRGSASLVYSSFLGGDRDNKGHSVAVEASGRYIAVAGYTNSTDFPIPASANSYRRHAPEDSFTSNGFVVQIEAKHPGSLSSGYSMRYSTYLGADKDDPRDDTYGMVLDSNGLIVATGRTQSAYFPMTNGGPTIFNSAPYLKRHKSGDEPYLVKIDPSLDGEASLVYSTFLGGGQEDGQWGSFCTSVGLDALGTVYVAGESNALGQAYDPYNQEAPQEFPYTENALYTALQGYRNVIFMQIDPGGAPLGYSTYLGGTDSDRAYGLAVDSASNVVLTGLTGSADFPLENPAQTWPGNAGSLNAFVTKFSAGALGR
ncbi:MAG: SBBP repeat-containing protein [Deltaproteobacteria bacterium]|nr:SBBP repeat-containing protein [Deltaproteobacteria bacterium]